MSGDTYACQFSSAISFTRRTHSSVSGRRKHSSTAPRCSAHSDILYPYTCPRGGLVFPADL
uniref:Uncharacterized protein n=1 Tax=Arundo donax TaxID=35708 RepID=A0A0A8XZ72_ARUDO